MPLPQAGRKGIGVENVLDLIIQQCQQLEICEQRSRSADYFEAVITNREFPQWSERLAQQLGPALKPAGAGPSRDAKRVAEAFGGIRKEQTLFYKVFEDCAVIAMFWPWGNKTQSTLKIWKTPPPA